MGAPGATTLNKNVARNFLRPKRDEVVTFPPCSHYNEQWKEKYSHGSLREECCDEGCDLEEMEEFLQDDHMVWAGTLLYTLLYYSQSGLLWSFGYCKPPLHNFVSFLKLPCNFRPVKLLHNIDNTPSFNRI